MFSRGWHWSARLLRWWMVGGLIVLIGAGAVGCSSLTRLYFYPQQAWVRTPDDLGLEYQDVYLTAVDATRVHGWWMSGVRQPAAIVNRDSISAESARPMVLFLHGNGENISTHIGSVAWLVYEGVDVFALDYRGYGSSEGNAMLPDVLQDIDAAAGWLRQQYPERPLVVLGQSMGAGLALIFGHEAATRYNIRAVVAEAAPASYSRAAREILSRNPLGWFVWPFTWLLPEQWNPENFTANYPVPVLLLHSRDDQVVGYYHGRKLFGALGGTACWQDTAGPHIAGFASSTVRQRVLKFIRIGGC